MVVSSDHASSLVMTRVTLPAGGVRVRRLWRESGDVGDMATTVDDCSRVAECYGGYGAGGVRPDPRNFQEFRNCSGV